MSDTLPLEVASGILIAATIMWMMRCVLILWRKDDAGMAILLFILTAQLGGGLILAGLGVWSF